MWRGPIVIDANRGHLIWMPLIRLVAPSVGVQELRMNASKPRYIGPLCE